jgi:hypothetical protein
MVEERKLIKDDGTVYIWSEALAKRKDMRPYTTAERTGIEIPTATNKAKTIPIELQGEPFLVEENLHAVLMSMGGVMVALQEENEALKKSAEDFEALKERLTTDIEDLTQQLAAAKATPKAEQEQVDAPATDQKKRKK